MLLEYSHLSNHSLLLFLCICYGYLLVFIHSITVAHQLPIDILPPISSKKDKTLWIGGKYIIY
jgi:energy-converting hydrogenase Eha subunit A